MNKIYCKVCSEIEEREKSVLGIGELKKIVILRPEITHKDTGSKICGNCLCGRADYNE